MSDMREAKTYPVRFVWDRGEAGEVHVCMTSSSGQSRTISMMKNRQGFHETHIRLAPGRYEYRFVVDGTWTYDENLPALRTDRGHYSNMIKVKIPSTDNEVQTTRMSKAESHKKSMVEKIMGPVKDLATRRKSGDQVKKSSSAKDLAPNQKVPPSKDTVMKKKAKVAKSKSGHELASVGPTYGVPKTPKVSKSKSGHELATVSKDVESTPKTSKRGRLFKVQKSKSDHELSSATKILKQVAPQTFGIPRSSSRSRSRQGEAPLVRKRRSSSRESKDPVVEQFVEALANNSPPKEFTTQLSPPGSPLKSPPPNSSVPDCFSAAEDSTAVHLGSDVVSTDNKHPPEDATDISDEDMPDLELVLAKTYSKGEEEEPKGLFLTVVDIVTQEDMNEPEAVDKKIQVNTETITERPKSREAQIQTVSEDDEHDENGFTVGQLVISTREKEVRISQDRQLSKTPVPPMTCTTAVQTEQEVAEQKEVQQTMLTVSEKYEETKDVINVVAEEASQSDNEKVDAGQIGDENEEEKAAVKDEAEEGEAITGEVTAEADESGVEKDGDNDIADALKEKESDTMIHEEVEEIIKLSSELSELVKKQEEAATDNTVDDEPDCAIGDVKNAEEDIDDSQVQAKGGEIDEVSSPDNQNQDTIPKEQENAKDEEDAGKDAGAKAQETKTMTDVKEKAEKGDDGELVSDTETLVPQDSVEEVKEEVNQTASKEESSADAKMNQDENEDSGKPLNEDSKVVEVDQEQMVSEVTDDQPEKAEQENLQEECTENVVEIHEEIVEELSYPKEAAKDEESIDFESKSAEDSTDVQKQPEASEEDQTATDKHENTLDDGQEKESDEQSNLNVAPAESEQLEEKDGQLEPPPEQVSEVNEQVATLDELENHAQKVEDMIVKEHKDYQSNESTAKPGENAKEAKHDAAIDACPNEGSGDVNDGIENETFNTSGDELPTQGQKAIESVENQGEEIAQMQNLGKIINQEMVLEQEELHVVNNCEAQEKVEEVASQDRFEPSEPQVGNDVCNNNIEVEEKVAELEVALPDAAQDKDKSKPNENVGKNVATLAVEESLNEDSSPVIKEELKQMTLVPAEVTEFVVKAVDLDEDETLKEPKKKSDVLVAIESEHLEVSHENLAVTVKEDVPKQEADVNTIEVLVDEPNEELLIQFDEKPGEKEEAEKNVVNVSVKDKSPTPAKSKNRENKPPVLRKRDLKEIDIKKSASASAVPENWVLLTQMEDEDSQESLYDEESDEYEIVGYEQTMNYRVRNSPSSSDEDMGNWPAREDRKRGPGKEDIFSQVRREMNSIQRSRSHSDLVIKRKLQKSASTSQFIADLKERRAQNRKSREMEAEVVATMAEAAKEQQSPKMKKKKRVRRSQSKQARMEREKKMQEEEAKKKMPIDDEDEEMVLPIVPRKRNPYEEMPKKLDSILGPIRNQGPPPPQVPVEPPIVFLEPGNYSVSGLNADVRLKQVPINGRKIDLSRRGESTNGDSMGRRIREPMFQVPGKPVKFPKPPKPKERQEEEISTPTNDAPSSEEKVGNNDLFLTEMSAEKFEEVRQKSPVTESTVLTQTSGIKIEMIPKDEQVEAWLSKAQKTQDDDDGDISTSPAEEMQIESMQTMPTTQIVNEGGKEELLIDLEGSQQNDDTVETNVELQEAQNSLAVDLQKVEEPKKNVQPQKVEEPKVEPKQKVEKPKEKASKKPKKPAVASKPALPKALVKPAVEEIVEPVPAPARNEQVDQPQRVQEETFQPMLAPIVTSADNLDDVKLSQPLKLGINGFERTGRLVLLAALESGVEVAAVNDAFTPANFMVYALKHDLAHSKDKWRRKKELEVKMGQSNGGNQLIIGGHSVEVFDRSDVGEIPWASAGVNCVVETVEKMESVAQAKRHLRAAQEKSKAVQTMIRGLNAAEAAAARAKLLSAPTSSYIGCTRVFLATPGSSSASQAPLFAVGANTSHLDGRQIVTAHVSPAAAAMLPVLRVLHQEFGGVRSCAFTLVKSVRDASGGIKGPAELGPTSHGKTKKWDFSSNLVPVRPTELESELTRVMPCLSGRASGLCVYAPTQEVSMLDLTVRLAAESGSIYKQACLAVKEACENGGLRGVVRYIPNMSEENLASSLFAGESHSGVFDAKSGSQVSRDTVRAVIWFDNEVGIASRIVDLVSKTHRAMQQQPTENN